MKTTIVNAAAVSKYNRMDAEFHIAVQPVESAAEECAKVRTSDEISQLLSKLDINELKALVPLLRGSLDASRKSNLLKAVAEYPFISFVLVQQSLEMSIARARRVVAEQQNHVALLETLRPVAVSPPLKR